MAADPHNKTIKSRQKSEPYDGNSDRLFKWLLFSFVFHGILVVLLFVSPYFPRFTRSAPPVYTVDLVGGEKIGGNRPGADLISPPVSKQPAKSVASEPPTPPVTKKESVRLKEKVEKAAKAETLEKPQKAEKIVKAEKIEKPEKVEKSVGIEKPETAEKVGKTTKMPEKSTSTDEKVPANEPSREKSEPVKDAGSDPAPQTASLDRVRERLIQSAVDRVKTRAEGAQKAAASAKGGEVLSVGPGEGDGAAALGPGGGRGGGNIVKGADFFIYQNKIVSTIKENWAWPGQKANLKALVRFGIKDNGEIIGVKISEPSGDPAFDESILRALRQSSPLPAPPEPYRKDFSQVEMNFQP